MFKLDLLLLTDGGGEAETFETSSRNSEGVPKAIFFN